MWKWIGKDAFIPGVPPRDMSSKEVKRRNILHIVEASSLFIKADNKKKRSSDRNKE